MPFGPPPPGLQQRLSVWKPRLIDLVNTRGTTPYEYGTQDCATFAREAVLAVTGVSLLPGIELPKGWLSAAKFLIKNDLADVEELASAALGYRPGEPSQSRPGDLIMFFMSAEKHLAVRVGDTAVTPSNAGLVTIYPSSGSRAGRSAGTRDDNQNSGRCAAGSDGVPFGG
jgi:hypothetical protein